MIHRRGVLSGALVRPGRIAVRLVLGQDGAQMPVAEDQHAVEELPAKGAGKRSQIAFMRGAWTAVRRILVAAGLEDGVERGGEVRSAAADQKLDAREPLVEAEGSGGPGRPWS